MMSAVQEMLLSDPAFRVYAVCVVVLVVKMTAVGSYTPIVRSRHKVTLNPEDAGRGGRTLVQAEHPEVERVLRAHRNDLENIPSFFALGLIHVLVGGPLLGAYVCFIGFTLARIGHSLFYLKGVQPWRSLCFGLGSLATAALMVQILSRVL